MTTTTDNGFNQTGYNAIVHAIWRIDRDIAKATDPEMIRLLTRDRKALSDIFIR